MIILEEQPRIGEHVMCRSVYSYTLRICNYAPNIFSALLNWPNRRILARILAETICTSQFSRLLINLCENAENVDKYSVFTYSWLFSENCRVCGSAFIYVIYHISNRFLDFFFWESPKWWPEVHRKVRTLLFTKEQISEMDIKLA